MNAQPPARISIEKHSSGWPGYWTSAISFLRRTRVAIYEGVYAQHMSSMGQGGVSTTHRSGLHSVKACGNVQEAGRLLRPSSIHCSDTFRSWASD